MNLSLNDETSRRIEDRVASGQYKSAEEVIAAAVAQLDHSDAAGQFDSGELDRLLAAGESSGAPISADAVFDALTELRNRDKTR